MIIDEIIIDIDKVSDLVDLAFNDRESRIIDSYELVQVQIILENLHSNLFNKVFIELSQVYKESGNKAENISYHFSQIALKFEKSIECISECSNIWDKIYEATRQVCLESDALKREELLHYRWVVENQKDSFIKKIAVFKSNINDIKDTIDRLTLSNSDLKISELRCLITGQQCGKAIANEDNEIFIGLQFTSTHYNTDSFKTVINRVSSELNLKPFFANEHYEPLHISCEICRKLQQVPIAIFEISDGNPNVMFEIGLACALGKSVILLSKQDSPGTKVSDLAGIHRLQYLDLVQCEKMLLKYFKDSMVLNIDLGNIKEVVS